MKENIIAGNYQGIDIPVSIEALPNEKGFVSLGTGRLIHNMSGYRLSLDDMNSDAAKRLVDTFPLQITNKALESTQTEYNYREKGKCIVLSTKDCCYYVYSESQEFIVTKLEFAVEELGRLRFTLS